MNILLTGATGFVGRGLLGRLIQADQYVLTAVVRRLVPGFFTRCVTVAELDASTDWSAALVDQQIVVHCAARAHIMSDEEPDPLAEYRRVNVEGTLNLARQAASAGVRRFVFISSIKVNGEQTFPGRPFSADDLPAPEDSYGLSKYEAEQGLQKLAADSGMEVVIIRPPLVYGPGVKGNFASMIRLVKKGLPLPLGAVHNKRSLVALDNLVDLIIRCIDHPAAANQVFLVSDGQDLSTSELLHGIAHATGKSALLIPVPRALLVFGASVLGKKAMAQRLLGSLQVDISKTCTLLDWQPSVSVDKGLARAVEADQPRTGNEVNERMK